MKEILSSAPDEHREWLEDELKYSNEPPLAQRLKETLVRCETITARLVGGSRNMRKGFVRKVVTTRNFEIHLDPDNEREAATGVKLVVLVFQLRALVEMTLLLDLGFTCQNVDAIFDRIRRYEQIDHLRRAADHAIAIR